MEDLPDAQSDQGAEGKEGKVLDSYIGRLYRGLDEHLRLDGDTITYDLCSEI